MQKILIEAVEYKIFCIGDLHIQNICIRGGRMRNPLDCAPRANTELPAVPSQPALAFVKDRILRHNILNLEGKSR
jgi:hypothetical protein